MIMLGRSASVPRNTRRLVAEGKQQEAEKLGQSLYGRSGFQKAYQPFCDLYLDFTDPIQRRLSSIGAAWI